jgi:hypothetical protein
VAATRPARCSRLCADRPLFHPHAHGERFRNGQPRARTARAATSPLNCPGWTAPPPDNVGGAGRNGSPSCCCWREGARTTTADADNVRAASAPCAPSNAPPPPMPDLGRLSDAKVGAPRVRHETQNCDRIARLLLCKRCARARSCPGPHGTRPLAGVARALCPRDIRFRPRPRVRLPPLRQAHVASARERRRRDVCIRRVKK